MINKSGISSWQGHLVMSDYNFFLAINSKHINANLHWLLSPLSYQELWSRRQRLSLCGDLHTAGPEGVKNRKYPDLGLAWSIFLDQVERECWKPLVWCWPDPPRQTSCGGQKISWTSPAEWDDPSPPARLLSWHQPRSREYSTARLGRMMSSLGPVWLNLWISEKLSFYQ